MAKVKELTLPVDPVDIPSANSTPEVDAKVNGHGDSVVIEVPLCRDMPPVGFCLHVDARLTPDQSNALRKTAAALDQQNARLANGKRIVHPTDALKFILERLADAAT